MNTPLDLQKDAKERLDALRTLSNRAEAGDRDARRELRTAVRESSPEIVAWTSDFAKRGQQILIETISGGEPLMEEAISVRLDLLRTELAGESPQRT